MTETSFIFMLLAYSAGALTALVGGGRGWLGRGLVAIGAMVGAGAGLALAGSVILSGNSFSLSIPALLPVGGGLVLSLDPLGAFFLFLIGIGAIPAALYGSGYTAAYEHESVSLRLLGIMFNLFLLSMSLVTMAGNVLTFLIAWEAMSLTSYFLVISENEAESTLRAGLWYAAMTHAGLALLIAAFLLLSNNGSGSFSDLRTGAGNLPAATRNIVFILALLGFGSKAGIVPLHVWLPKAHPAAPSHVSALMSGVMVKLGIYGLLRIGLDLLGGGPAWWGGIVLVAGVVSALLGILYALMEIDLKRLLAYSTVENVGIILIGIGAGLVFNAYGLTSLAFLALVGGLFHSLNHAGFKGLLFLGAGSVLHATGTRNMEKLGGLIQRMPWTAFFFLLGSAAIAALPPLNGFASEWIIFQSLLAGFKLPRPELAVLMPIAVGLLALTSGLAAACFVKAFGISFLAIPRSARAEDAQDAPFPMFLGMALLAFACVVLGLAPTLVVPWIARTVSGLGGLPTAAPQITFSLTLQPPDAFGQISPALTFIGLALIIALIPLALRLFGASRARRLGETWGCGRTGQTPRMQYTATAFAEPLRRVFAEIYRPTKELSISFHPDSKYFVESIEYKSEITPLFDRWVYDPLLRLLVFLSRQVLRLQAGSLHLYLLFIAILLVFLLLIARWL
jgi:hydrogenase-4 component B